MAQRIKQTIKITKRKGLSAILHRAKRNGKRKA